MKRLLALVAILAIFTACNSGTGNTDAKKQTDSIAALSSKGKMTTTMMDGQPPANPYDDLIDTAMANKYIQNWHKSLNIIDSYKNKGLPPPAFAFAIPVENLKTIMSSGANTVIVYLAQDGQKNMTLVYLGAKAETDPKDSTKNTYTEMLITNPTDSSISVFDNVCPCPTCNLGVLHGAYKNGGKNH